MSGGLGSGLKRFILWDYKRAGWQYDLMVGVILAFIFLTPRDWFRDQPRTSSMWLLPSSQVWMARDLLEGIPEAERHSRATQLITARFGKQYQVLSVEPMLDAEQDVRGYIAQTKP
jgi:hypothetical protein